VTANPKGGFAALSPSAVLKSVEAAFGLDLRPVVTPYPSYVNRVYGLQDADGGEYVAKFYRPGRWDRPTIEEEHAFAAELDDADVPVVPPLPDGDGETLAEVAVRDEDAGGREQDFLFALYPRRGGRLFEAESDEAWIRMGALAGRLHLVARRREAKRRPVALPALSTAGHLASLAADGIVPPDHAAAFAELAAGVLERIGPLFEGVPVHRLHGDLHRGNILDRPGEGLLLIDLDDMMIGPAMQALGLLLPGRGPEVRREIALLAEGYEEFASFPWDQVRLVEPLRFMRMIHFIAWCARQRGDYDFARHFPHWGEPAWWIREMEDLADQARWIAGAE
jgi:Ser/Thr protein kinase RdoA (MazF antagonist)